MCRRIENFKTLLLPTEVKIRLCGKHGGSITQRLCGKSIHTSRWSLPSRQLGLCYDPGSARLHSHVRTRAQTQTHTQTVNLINPCLNFNHYLFPLQPQPALYCISLKNRPPRGSLISSLNHSSSAGTARWRALRYHSSTGREP